MHDSLENTLSTLCQGAIAFLGIGNADRGDDGAGVILARLLREAGVPIVFEGGATPERVIPSVREGGFDTVVFLDAVDAGAVPGSVVILDADEMISRYPQISTHKLSMGTLARLVADGTHTRVVLLGIQPTSIGLATELSPEVDDTVHMLAQRIAASTVTVGSCGERVCS